MHYLITGGQNRVMLVQLISNAKNLVYAIDHLTEVQKTVSPDLQWVVFPAAELSETIGVVKNDPNSFRIRDGAIEQRPMAWVRLDRTSPHVGDLVVVDVDFSAEPTLPKLVAVDGVIQEAPFRISCDQAVTMDLVPVSEVHRCFVFTLEISE